MKRLLLLVLAALAAAPALAQRSVADVAAYTGPDRQQRLIEGAKKEGFVMVYNSAPVDIRTRRCCSSISCSPTRRT